MIIIEMYNIREHKNNCYNNKNINTQNNNAAAGDYPSI